eukprot:gene2102-2801_t
MSLEVARGGRSAACGTLHVTSGYTLASVDITNASSCPMSSTSRNCSRCPEVHQGSDYDIYLVAEDVGAASGNGSVGNVTHRIHVHTASSPSSSDAEKAPLFASGSPMSTVSGGSYIHFSVSFNTSLDSNTVAFLVLPAGSSTTFVVSSLVQQTSYDIYFAGSGSSSHGLFEQNFDTLVWTADGLWWGSALGRQAYTSLRSLQTSVPTAPIPTISAQSTPCVADTTPYLISVEFDRPVRDFECWEGAACNVGVEGGSVTNSSISQTWDSDDRVYSFHVDVPADGQVTITVPAGAALDKYDTVQSAAAAALSFTCDVSRPVPLLEEVSSTQLNMIFRISFSEVVTGFDQMDLELTGCQLTSFTEISANQMWEATVSFDESYAYARVGLGSAVDSSGNANVASNSLERWFAGHQVPAGLSIAGNLVPWGASICLTPDDLLDFVADCPLPTCDVGGCAYATCAYEKFRVDYTEWNDGWTTITGLDGQYTNALYYDGELMELHQRPSLPPGAYADGFTEVRYYNTSRPQVDPNEMAYWGSGIRTGWDVTGFQLFDGQRHTISIALVLGEDDVAQTAAGDLGTIGVYYCGWPGMECGCGLDLLPAPGGMWLGARRLPWTDSSLITVANSTSVSSNTTTSVESSDSSSSTSTTTTTTTTTVVVNVTEVVVPCIEPEDVVRRDGVDGLELTATEVEGAFMRGGSALARNYTRAQPAFRTRVTSTELHRDGQPAGEAEVLGELGPHTMLPGEEANSTIFVPLFPKDGLVRRVGVTVDWEGSVAELDENNNARSLELEMCWPADLTPGTYLQVLADQEDEDAEEHTIDVGFGGHVCIQPSHHQSSLSTDLTLGHVIVELVYWDVNIGKQTAYGVPQTEAVALADEQYGWANSLFLDGELVHVDHERGPLIPEARTSQHVVLDLGAPDDRQHLLQIFVDSQNTSSGWNQVGQERAEADETNNMGNITISFCGWGADVWPGDNLTIGTRNVQWGDEVCLTDEDLIRTNMETFCLEGGCWMIGADETMIFMEYNEINRGSQRAEALDGGWLNMFYYDGEEAIVNIERPALEVNATRKVLAHGTNRYGVDSYVFEPFDLEPHTLTLRLDAHDEVPWRDQHFQTEWSITVKFCTSELLASHGKCGCSEPDLTANNSIAIGAQEVRWGETVCLGAEDMVAYAANDGTVLHGVDLTYSEYNDGLVDMEGSWTNQIYYDSIQVITDPGRTTLAALASREQSHLWGFESINKVTVEPDDGRHTLSIVIDAGSQVKPVMVDRSVMSITNGASTWCSGMTNRAVSDPACDCVYAMEVRMRMLDLAEPDDLNENLFTSDVAENLDVRIYQVIIESTMVGSIIVTFEVQPPLGEEWFPQQSKVDSMYDMLRKGELELHESLGAYEVLGVSIPVTTDYESESQEPYLLLILCLTVGAFLLLIVGAVSVVWRIRKKRSDAMLLAHEEDVEGHSPFRSAKVAPCNATPAPGPSSTPPPTLTADLQQAPTLSTRAEEDPSEQVFRSGPPGVEMTTVQTFE